MNMRILRNYIRSFLQENFEFDARVPTQLVPSHHEERTDEEDDSVKEFSSAGGVSGFVAPLGAKPHRKIVAWS
jgi:hypothetical protein